MEINTVEVPDAHVRTSLETLSSDIWSDINIIVAIFEVSRFDEVGDPFGGVVVLLAASHLVSMPLFNVLNLLRPAVYLNISVHNWVLLSDNTKLRIRDGTIDIARSLEKYRILLISKLEGGSLAEHLDTCFILFDSLLAVHFGHDTEADDTNSDEQDHTQDEA